MRDQQTHTFTSHDGLELFYRHWPATDSGQPRRALVLFHRGHEHSGRMAHLADELDLPGFDIFAWDARGLGQSPGPRGDSPSFGTSVRDVQSFIAHLRDQHGIAEQDMVVLAQSVGAVLVATWAHDYAPNIRALVLASPAFRVKLYVPFARPGLKLLRAVQQSIDCQDLKADTDAQQLVYEMYGLILALHHDARFLRMPGSVDRARAGFERLVMHYQNPLKVSV